jgi:membrane protein YqaA with SNARE-associated domain
MAHARTTRWINQLKNKGFFRYLGKSVLIIVLVYALLVLLAVLIGKYLVDFNQLFQGMIDRLSDRLVVVLFFLSESFLGLIPVDLFVIWSQKFSHPLPSLVMLGVLSYAGGIVSYGIGDWISRRKRIREFTEKRLENYINFVRKWGGAFIVVAALFPFTPFSMVVIALTLLQYPFRWFLLFAIARICRFALQGVFFFDLLKVDTWIVAFAVAG